MTLDPIPTRDDIADRLGLMTYDEYFHYYLAIIIVAVVALSLLWWRRSLKGALFLTGVVTGHEPREAAEAGWTYHPIIEVTVETGEAINFTSGLGSGSGQKKWPVGSKVDVRVDRHEPEHYDPEFVVWNVVWITVIVVFIVLAN